MLSTSSNMFPFFRYRDAEAAIDWLARAFGFEKKMVVPEADGTIAHAELQLGSGFIMVGSGGDWQGTKTVEDIRDVKQGVYMYVEDADAHYARAKVAGAEITREIENTDYGSREYSVRDIGGYYWSFGTYRPEA